MEARKRPLTTRYKASPPAAPCSISVSPRARRTHSSSPSTARIAGSSMAPNKSGSMAASWLRRLRRKITSAS
jgi:hypothetical protein